MLIVDFNESYGQPTQTTSGYPSSLGSAGQAGVAVGSADCYIAAVSSRRPQLPWYRRAGGLRLRRSQPATAHTDMYLAAAAA